MKTFYAVVRSNCIGYNNRKHETFEDALIEAKRLCQQENNDFIILKALTVVAMEAVSMSVTNLEGDDADDEDTVIINKSLTSKDRPNPPLDTINKR